MFVKNIRVHRYFLDLLLFVMYLSLNATFLRHRKIKKMNDLYKLFKLRGTTLRQIARETGVEYCSLQKTAKGVRNHPGMQKALAAYFGVDAKLLFGPHRALTIRHLMDREIEKQSAKLRDELRRRYLEVPWETF